ncbi:MAG TPA: hypothetical protein PKA64_13260 [Myxococcota bacterium]|nr:hypothetical protein [Myxococcota bacterium]
MWTLLWLAACNNDYGVAIVPETIQAPENPPQLGATIIEDVLRQRIPEAVDILWVIDNSNSMLAEQQKLGENFPAFLDYYLNSGLDWQIGVVSTDLQDPAQSGKLQGAAGFLWADPSVPDPAGVFSRMALLGRGGSSKEQGRGAAWAALTPPLLETTNAGFYRPSARLSVIVVSDEQDFSDDLSVNTFIDWYLHLKPDPSMVDFSAIISMDPACNDGRMGTDYLPIVHATGGSAFSICEDDWTPILAALGIRAAGLQREFFLTEVPDPSTLSVWIDDEEVRYDFVPETDFVYDGDHNSINFTRYTPRATAYIHIQYATAVSSHQ